MLRLVSKAEVTSLCDVTRLESDLIRWLDLLRCPVDIMYG